MDIPPGVIIQKIYLLIINNISPPLYIINMFIVIGVVNKKLKGYLN